MEGSKIRRAGCHDNREVVLSIVARPIVTEVLQPGGRGRLSSPSSVWGWHHCVVLVVVHVLLHHSTSHASAAVGLQNDASFNALASTITDVPTTTISSSSSSNSSSSSDVAPTSRRHRTKRSVIHLYHMLKCTTNCNPLSYKGYGCYCGFLGQGSAVDGIDQCCKQHDWCYEKANFCSGLEWYLAPFNWRCNDGKPYCVRPARGLLMTPRTCGHQLCECDRAFAECLRHQPCPKKKAMCLSSAWRLAQNILMSFLSGTGIYRTS